MSNTIDRYLGKRVTEDATASAELISKTEELSRMTKDFVSLKRKTESIYANCIRLLSTAQREFASLKNGAERDRLRADIEKCSAIVRKSAEELS